MEDRILLTRLNGTPDIRLLHPPATPGFHWEISAPPPSAYETTEEEYSMVAEPIESYGKSK